jgi:NADH-quinone oxidoreductase subunit A
LVAILFIIFDLELLFLFPWIICFNSLSYEGIFVMLFFLFLLTIGFIYEWYEGALDWS